MYIPSSKNMSICFYCQDFQKEEKDYPLRKGKYSAEGLVHRCIWHAKFQCSECNSFFHFSFLYWCPTANKVVCGKCNKPTFHPVKFWNKTYAYAFECDDCNQTHYDLLYTEFMGKHPWQVNKRKLFNEENPLNSIISSRFPWDPIWKPAKEREGTEITIEEALRNKNLVQSVWKETGGVNLHS